MTALLPLMLSALLGAHAGVASPAARDQQELGVAVALRGYRADGTLAIGTATDVGASVVSLFVASDDFCSLGGGASLFARPGTSNAWRVSARVLSRTADSITAEVSWDRILKNGQATDEHERRTVTATVNAPAILETFTPSSARCSATEARLELLAAMPHSIVVRPRAAGGTGMAIGGGSGTGVGVGGSGMAGGGIGNGVGASAGGGIGTRSGTSAGATGGGASGSGGSGGSSGSGGSGSSVSGASGGSGSSIAGGLATSPIPATRPEAPLGQPFGVEIWLVHTLPDGSTRVDGHETGENAASYTRTFAPVAITTPNGTAMVTVTAELRSLARAQYPFAVMLSRIVTGGGIGGNGAATKVGDFPGPEEVIEFSLPALTRPGQSPSVKDQFSIRVRIKSA